MQAPTALLAATATDASFNPTSGSLLLLFDFALVELYLPDPYTGNTEPRLRGGQNLFPNDKLLAEITWPNLTSAQLRLLDTNQSHSQTPPSTEASSDAVPPAPHIHIKQQQLISPDIAALQHAPQPVSSSAVGAAIAPADAPPPSSSPIPDLPTDEMLLDVSTRASQFLACGSPHQKRSTLHYAIDETLGAQRSRK